MLNEIPWVGGSDAERPGAVPPAVAAFDALPGELRDHELLRVSAGEEIPGLAEELAVPLPPPRKERRSVLLPDDQPPPPPPPAGPPRPGPGAGRPKGSRPT